MKKVIFLPTILKNCLLLCFVNLSNINAASLLQQQTKSKASNLTGVPIGKFYKQAYFTNNKTFKKFNYETDSTKLC